MTSVTRQDTEELLNAMLKYFRVLTGSKPHTMTDALLSSVLAFEISKLVGTIHNFMGPQSMAEAFKESGLTDEDFAKLISPDA